MKTMAQLKALSITRVFSDDQEQDWNNLLCFISNFTSLYYLDVESTSYHRLIDNLRGTDKHLHDIFKKNQHRLPQGIFV